MDVVATALLKQKDNLQKVLTTEQTLLDPSATFTN